MKSLRLKAVDIQEMNTDEMSIQNGGCSENSIYGIIDKFYDGDMKDEQLQMDIIQCISKLYGVTATPSDF